MIRAPDECHHRYSQKPFPPYRFILGQNPHPTKDPQGHSFGQPVESTGILQEDTWYENETYLFGVDLYNYAFWWEAHESFESLWQWLAKDDPTSDYLQGLIKISAAFIKWNLKQQRGLETHYSGGIGHLQKVLDSSKDYMGLDLMNHIAKVSRHFKEVGSRPHKWPDPLVNYPFIVLAKV